MSVSKHYEQQLSDQIDHATRRLNMLLIDAQRNGLMLKPRVQKEDGVVIVEIFQDTEEKPNEG